MGGRAAALALIFAPFANAAPQKDAVIALEREWRDHGSDRRVLERIHADDFVLPFRTAYSFSKQQALAWALEHPRPADRRVRFEKLYVGFMATWQLQAGLPRTLMARRRSAVHFHGCFCCSERAVAGRKCPGERGVSGARALSGLGAIAMLAPSKAITLTF